VTFTAAVEGPPPVPAAAGWLEAGNTRAEVTTARVVPWGMVTDFCGWSNAEAVPEQPTSVPAMLKLSVPADPGWKVKVAVSGHTHQPLWFSQVPIARVTLCTVSGPAGVALGEGAAVAVGAGAAVAGAPDAEGGGGSGRGAAGAATTGERVTVGVGAGAVPPGVEGRTAVARGACEESGAALTSGAGDVGSIGAGCRATPLPPGYGLGVL
jgi:hypothetical protein